MGKTITLAPDTATLGATPTRELVARYQTSTLEAMLQRRTRRAIEQAMNTLGEDAILFLPTPTHQQESLFAGWATERRDRFDQFLDQALQSEFEELEADWSQVRDSLADSLWPGIEWQLVQLALRSLATRWILRKLGDAVSLGELEPFEGGWKASLGVRGRGTSLGQLVLDSAGQVIEEQTTSRSELNLRARAA